MKMQETIDLLNFIKSSYKMFEISDGTIDSWSEELSQYDYEEVKSKLKSYMAEDKFQNSPPTVYYLVKGLAKCSDKIDYSKDVIYCDICNRPFQNYNELKKHFDRCSSVRYIVQQYKKLNRTVDKATLYNLSQEEFDEKYNKLLKYVMENTTDENERMRIGFIFNPPTQEEAMAFLAGQ